MLLKTFKSYKKLTRYSQILRRGRSMTSMEMKERERTVYTPLMIGFQLMSISEQSIQNYRKRISLATQRDTDFQMKSKEI